MIALLLRPVLMGNLIGPAQIVLAVVLSGPAVSDIYGEVYAGDPEAVLEVFEYWADQRGSPVTMPACSGPSYDGTTIVACFGFADGQLVRAFLSFDDDDLLVMIAGYSASDVTVGGPLFEPTATSPDGYPSSFPDGTWAVNEEIAPDTYRTTEAEPTCEWEITPGDPDEATITGRVAPDGEWVVEISESDVEFWSEDCIEWVRQTE